MTKVYNSPPNWPAPPPGWTPGEGWAPDPSWGPAPQGWQFWTDVSPEPAAPATPAPTTLSRSSDDPDDLRVFISYRRADTRSHVNGLYDGLATRLPDASIFMDLDSIPAGVDFEEHIRTEISRCDVVLVVIGDDWLNDDPTTGRPRLHHPDDFVRLEIESALKNPRVVVIPVLVEGTGMPASTALPESIRRLARINALALDDTRWRADLSRLVARINEISLSKTRFPNKPAAGTARPAQAPTAAPTAPPTAAPRATSGPTTPVAAPQQPTYHGMPYGAAAPQQPPPQSFARYPGPATPGAPSAPGATAGRMSPKTIAVSVVMVVLPVVSCGILAFATPILAAFTRTTGGMWRTILGVAAVVIGVATITGLMLIGSAPKDASGTVTGPQADLGTTLWVIGILVAVVLGAVFWKPRR